MGREIGFDQHYVDTRTDGTLDQVAQVLEHHGMFVFDGIGSREDLVRFASTLGEIFVHKDSDSDGITRVAHTQSQDDTAWSPGLTSRALALHTDSSGIADPPTLMLLYCNEQAGEGGDTVLADTKAVYEDLSRRVPATLKALRADDSAVFMGDHEPYASSVYEGLPESEVRVRFRYDARGYFAPDVFEALPSFLDSVEKHSVSFGLEPGQGYVVHNGRWLHGRTQFRGEREMYRILINNDQGATPGTVRVRPGFVPEVPAA